MRKNSASILLLLLAAVCCSQRASAADWVDGRVFGPFVCRADFPLADHEAVFGHLANIQQDLIARLGIPPAQERIEVFLFKDKTAYTQYLKRWFPDVPYRRALYVKNSGPGMVFAFYSEDLPIDMRHECTHALLHASLPMVPLWLDEGLAEYYEVPPDERLSKNPHHGSLIWKLRFGQVPRIATLEAKRDLSEMGRSEYRNAWAWVHFLLNGPPAARQELIKFFAEIRAGAPPGVLSQRLGRVLENPERSLVQHFKTFPRS